MSTWKALLGVGLACSACCAVPLLGAGVGAVMGPALMARTEAALALLALAVVAGVFAWHRRRKARSATCACTATDGCEESCRLP